MLRVLVTDPGERTAWNRDYRRRALPRIAEAIRAACGEAPMFLAESEDSRDLLAELGLSAFETAPNDDRAIPLDISDRICAPDDTLLVVSGRAPLLRADTIRRALALHAGSAGSRVRSCVSPQDHPCQFRTFFAAGQVRSGKTERLPDQPDRLRIAIDGLDDRQPGNHVVAIASGPQGVFFEEIPLRDGRAAIPESSALREGDLLQCVVMNAVDSGRFDVERCYEPHCGYWRFNKNTKQKTDAQGREIWGRQVLPALFRISDHLWLGRGDNAAAFRTAPQRHTDLGVPLADEEALFVEAEVDFLQLRLAWGEF